MVEPTPRVCVECDEPVVRRHGVALCQTCTLVRRRASARMQYRKSQAKNGKPVKGDTVTGECDYCQASFDFVLRGRPRRVCDTCVRTKGGQARQRWGAENPDKLAVIKARYRRNHPDRVLGERVVARYKKYGVTAEWEAETLEAQGGRCGNTGCGATEPGGRWNTWHIDHCHDSLVARGLLCDKCNKGVGLFDDDIAKLAGMIEYLSRERASG